MDKHLAAQLLFNEGWDQKQIASVMKVSAQTIVSWKKKYDWVRKRTENTLARETSEESLWELIHYQLDVHKHWKEEQMKLEVKDRKLIDRGDIDGLTKMFISVKGKQLEWTNYVRICRELLDSVQANDLDLAKLLTAQVTNFLNNKRRSL